MLFRKEDLQGQHYNWNNQNTETFFTGVPSRRMFDRYNGDQVLFLINSCESLTDIFTIKEATEIEDLILNKLPLEAKSEISVFNWLRGYCIADLNN